MVRILSTCITDTSRACSTSYTMCGVVSVSLTSVGLCSQLKRIVYVYIPRSSLVTFLHLALTSTGNVKEKYKHQFQFHE